MFTEVKRQREPEENQLEPASLIVDKSSILGSGRGRFGSVTPVYRGTYAGTPVVIKQLTVAEGLVSNSEAKEILKRIHTLSTIRGYAIGELHRSVHDGANRRVLLAVPMRRHRVDADGLLTRAIAHNQAGNKP